MNYWGLLLAKLAGVAAIHHLLSLGLQHFRPARDAFGHQPLGHNMPWTFAVLLLNLFCVGLVALAFLDQRYRCRICLRRLRMPVRRGSYPNSMLIGTPRTEYICPFGHGTLNVPELKLGEMEVPAWQPHDEDIWKELETTSSHRDGR